ncbi:hypothetical protein [Paenibacillus spongiae]|uniref:Uncharacterized protein n=1 Tax=Paenibacillus spongiae TaxID=2909671 RepID=A0ABY5SB79_9BACL|nr:hypothetical protein [Paenibacillus spongiae]UVI31194.1 hypothetical protein L1F29_04950 [Paenibacillus spongiae]
MIYGKALAYFQEVQKQQIEKGRQKYPEPLNPASWTELELIDHAMQEAVDQVHYLTALRIKVLERQAEMIEMIAKEA